MIPTMVHYCQNSIEPENFQCPKRKLYHFKTRGDIIWLKYMATDAFTTESQCSEYMYRSVSLNCVHDKHTVNSGFHLYSTPPNKQSAANPLLLSSHNTSDTDNIKLLFVTFILPCYPLEKEHTLL